MEKEMMVSFETTEAQLNEIESYAGIEIEDKKSFGVAKKYRANIRTLRVKIDKRRKLLKQPFLDGGKKIDATAKYLTNRLFPVEKALQEKIDKEQSRISEIKNEKARIEIERISIITNNIGNIKSIVRNGQEYNLSSNLINSFINKLKEIEIDEGKYQEFTEDAKEIIKHGLDDLKVRFVARESFEQEQEKIKKEQARQLAAAKIMAEEKAKIEQEKAKIEQEKANIEAERAKIEAEEKAKIKAERAKIEAEEKAKIEAEEKAKIEAERAKIEAEKASHRKRLENYQIIDDNATCTSSDFEGARLVVYARNGKIFVKDYYEFQQEFV